MTDSISLVRGPIRERIAYGKPITTEPPKHHGKTITRIRSNDADLRFQFSDGTGLRFWDAGQNCCEHRYMHTDDDLSHFEGSTLEDIELRDGGSTEDNYSTKDCQFLVVTTSKGVFTVANYNEHNGYYGGFDIKSAPWSL